MWSEGILAQHAETEIWCIVILQESKRVDLHGEIIYETLTGKQICQVVKF